MATDNEITNIEAEVKSAVSGAAATATADLAKTSSSTRKRWLLALLALVLFAGGVAAGRFGLPAKVVTKTDIQTKTVTLTKTQYVDRIVTQKVYVKDTKEAQHVVQTETKKPDGTDVITTTTDTSTDTGTHVNTDTNNTTNATKTADASTDKTVDKTKTVSNMPDWMVQGGVGISIPYYLGQSSPGVPGLKGIVVDASLSRRIIGPFWLGLGANTQGVLSAKLTGTF
jgi:hypothetical protein